MNIILIKRGWGDGAVGIQLASRTHLAALQNDQPFPQDLTYVFRWGCTSDVPEGVKVVNTAKAIHWCYNKRQARLDMQEAGVSVPQTWTSEEFNRSRHPITAESYNNIVLDQFVARPATHTQGEQLNTGSAVDLVVFPGGYVSRLISKRAEYRVNIAQGRVVQLGSKSLATADQTSWMGERDRFNNVRWGDWPMQVVKEALAAAKVSGADFCGVDVLLDSNGKAYVLEVNSAPWLGNYGAKCFAKCFDFIVKNGKKHFDPVEWSPRTSWKSTIHPALIEEAA